jgi:hypothetical protein
MAVFLAWVSIKMPPPTTRAAVAWASLRLPEVSQQVEVAWASLLLPEAMGTSRPASGALVGAGARVVGIAVRNQAWTGAVLEQASILDQDTGEPTTGPGISHVASGVVVGLGSAMQGQATATPIQQNHRASSGVLFGASAHVQGVAVRTGQPQTRPAMGWMAGANAIVHGVALRTPSGYSLYPRLPQWEGTRLVARTGVMARLAGNNVYRTRALQETIKRDPIIVHRMLSASERKQLLDFYTLMRTMPFYFISDEDGVQRTCAFGADGIDLRPESVDYPGRWVATVQLREL